MINLKLNVLERNEVKNFKTLSEKRQYLQDYVIKNSVLNSKNKKYVWSLFPRFGKSYTVLKFINLFNSKYKDYYHLVITPSSHIKEEFIKLFNQNNINNVVVSTCSGVFTNNFKNKYANYKWGVIVGDEADVGMSSNTSILWSKVLNFKSKHQIMMSGTFSHSNLKVLSNAGFDVLIDINVEDGSYMNTLASFTTYNVGVDLTEKEKLIYNDIYSKMEILIKPYKSIFLDDDWADYAITNIGNPKIKYIKINNQIKTNIEWMNIIKNYTNWDIGVILGRKRRYLEHKNSLDEITSRAINKFKFINEYVNKNSKKGIIFTDSKNVCDDLQSQNSSILAYHSSSKNNIQLFNNDKNKKAIVSINKLSRGFTDVNIYYAINSSYNSKNNNYVQRMSRVLSIDDTTLDKESIIINLYCKEFTNNYKTIEPRDLMKLKIAQKDIFIEWVDSDFKFI